MQYPAQVQACIDLLAVQLKNQSVADRLLYGYFRGRRYIGSKDRAKITELFYAFMRQRLRIEHYAHALHIKLSPEHCVAIGLWLDGAELREVFTGDKYQPSKLSHDVLERLNGADLSSIEIPINVEYNVPSWLIPYFSQNELDEELYLELKALNQEAPVDIRVNTLSTTREEVLEELRFLDISAQATTLSELGIRFTQRVPVSNLALFKKGGFEVQDEGSQLLAAACGVSAGDKVIDFCAGAGGKTLALAAAMNNKGTIIACDISEPRLNELSKRAKRAGVFNVRTLLLNHEHDKRLKRHIKTADVVLIDAPCSGSGAWRRNPDARFNISEDWLTDLTKLQSAILESASRLVKPQGRLVYATCSMFSVENENQISSFLNNNNELYDLLNVKSVLPNIPSESEFLKLSPAKSNTDGFFAAILQRRPEAKDDAVA